MTRIHARAERIIDAEPEVVWAALTDYANTRARILPANYLDYHAERGVDGVSATLTYRLRAGGRERAYCMDVEEATPGQLLVERDQTSTFTTRWLVERIGPGQHTRIRLASEWESRARGVNGFFERQFAPMGIRRIHQETLLRLGRALREEREGMAPAD